jgi:hypothetical protein
LTRKYEKILLRPEHEPAERRGYPIQGKEMTVMITWIPLGFWLIESLPKWRLFNLEDEYDHVFAALIPLQQEDGRRKLVLHADDVTVNTGYKIPSLLGQKWPTTRHPLAVVA